MALLTLKQFINQSHCRNADVGHRNFERLYVRMAAHVVNGALVDTFDIANIEAKTQRSGSFRRLVAQLRKMQPRPIYVENVHSVDFGDALCRLGFRRLGIDQPHCYILYPTDKYAAR